jgi:hypothetical protein
VKRIIAVCFAGLLLFAGVASAATPTQRISALEKKLKTLTTTVTKQQKTIKTLTQVLDATLAVEVCISAITADAFQSTWTTIDQAGGTNLFGPQQTITDKNLCSALEITRQGIRNPPTPAAFSAVVSLITGSRAKLSFG